MYQRILVAIDATPETPTVLGHTAALAKAVGATVRVLHIQTIDVVQGGALGGAVEEQTAGEAAQTVRDALATLKDAGVADTDGYTGETVRGDIGNTVLAQAKAFGADLIVLGARRHGGLASLWLGSVSDTVTHHADVPVLLVP